MKQFKGVVLKVRIEFIKQKGGKELLSKISRHLPEPYQELVEKEKGILPAWYPWEFLEILQDAMIREMGGRLELLEEVGRFGADMNVRGVYKLVFLVASPEFLIPRAAAIWTQQFSNGKIEAEGTAPKNILIRLRDFEGAVNQMDWIIRGWMKRIGELSGGKQVKVQPQPAQGAGVQLQYLVSWV